MEDNVQERLRMVSYEEFDHIVKELCKEVKSFLDENDVRVDYVVPLLRSGAVPAVFIANELNIVKFLPIQVKHISYQSGDKIEIIFDPLESVKIKKNNPVFLVVEGTHYTGTSVKICIERLLQAYPDARILYVCLFKEYSSQNFNDVTIFEMAGKIYGSTMEENKCKELNIDAYGPVYPWENMEDQINHPDDNEKNIFF